jgi:importin-5
MRLDDLFLPLILLLDDCLCFLFHNRSAVLQLSDVIHTLFDIKNADFLPYFDNIVNFFVEMIAPNRSAIDIQWALCVFDDLIEACGPVSEHGDCCL